MMVGKLLDQLRADQERIEGPAVMPHIIALSRSRQAARLLEIELEQWQDAFRNGLGDQLVELVRTEAAHLLGPEVLKALQASRPGDIVHLRLPLSAVVLDVESAIAGALRAASERANVSPCGPDDNGTALIVFQLPTMGCAVRVPAAMLERQQ